MRTAQFIEVGIGIAAEEIGLRTNMLQVSPIEQFSFLDGEIAENFRNHAYQGTNIDGSSYEGSVIQDNTFPAKWLPEGSNRVYPPSVQRGERVRLFKYGDSNTYFWRSMGLDDNLRRLETIVIAIGASPDGIIGDNSNGVDIDPTKCYFFEMSSHNKSISLHTSNSNGEARKYDIELNLNESTFNIGDDIENSIYLKSTDGEIGFTNSSGSQVKVIKETIDAKAKTINVEGTTINVKSTDCSIVANKVNVTSQEATVSAGGLLRLQGGSIRLVSPDIKSSTPIELG